MRPALSAGPAIATGAVIAAALFATSALYAQPIERDGLWLGGGLGVGHGAIDCASCGELLANDPWEGGLGIAGYFGIGRVLEPEVLVGAELNFWARKNFDTGRDATLLTVGVAGRYFPESTQRLFLTAGVGLGHSTLAGGNGLIESPGFAASAGVGYDVRVGRSTALSPFVRLVQIVGEGGEGRNQELPARGPDNPRFVQVGVALMHY